MIKEVWEAFPIKTRLMLRLLGKTKGLNNGTYKHNTKKSKEGNRIKYYNI